MSKPVYDALIKLDNENMYPFCMPGHKRNKAFFDEELFRLDFTEVEETDNLHNPSGIIKQAQELMAKACMSEDCFFCVNGSSGGVMGAIMSVCSENDSVLIGSNCHKSVFNALVLSGALPIYMRSEITACGIVGGISPETVERGIKEYPDIKAVVITSPTYEGFVSDIKGISDIAHKYNKILIVDSAHGAHFHFSDYFPKGAISEGADIVIESWHKTMPVLNQCSIVLCKKKYHSKLAVCLSMLQTTSPSYIFMALMDKYRDVFNSDKKYFENYTELLKKTRKRLSKLNNIEILDKNIIGKADIKDMDRGKLIICCRKMSGKRLADILHDKYKLQCEAQYESHIILMTSPADTAEGFERLCTALEEIDGGENFSERIKTEVVSESEFSRPKISPRKAFFSEKETIPLSESVGRISACFITPYPPGIPIIRMGDEISEEKMLKAKAENTEKIEVII